MFEADPHNVNTPPAILSSPEPERNTYENKDQNTAEYIAENNSTARTSQDEQSAYGGLRPPSTSMNKALLLSPLTFLNKSLEAFNVFLTTASILTDAPENHQIYREPAPATTGEPTEEGTQRTEQQGKETDDMGAILCKLDEGPREAAARRPSGSRRRTRRRARNRLRRRARRRVRAEHQDQAQSEQSQEQQPQSVSAQPVLIQPQQDQSLEVQSPEAQLAPVPEAEGEEEAQASDDLCKAVAENINQLWNLLEANPNPRDSSAVVNEMLKIIDHVFAQLPVLHSGYDISDMLEMHCYHVGQYTEFTRVDVLRNIQETREALLLVQAFDLRASQRPWVYSAAKFAATI